jgi:hypothetical protein
MSEAALIDLFGIVRIELKLSPIVSFEKFSLNGKSVAGTSYIFYLS